MAGAVTRREARGGRRQAASAARVHGSSVSPTCDVRILPDLQAIAQECAREFARAAREAVRDHGIFRVALAGGSTPRALHRRLIEPPYRASIAWGKVRFFWGDERCVSASSARSNYRMARETLLAPLGIPARHVFRLHGEEEPRRAAREYETILAQELGDQGRRPRFDLVLLGLGPDGHTASLFPGTKALAVIGRTAVANYVPKFRQWRLTLTYPVFNAARRVVFLAAGEEKRDPARRILRKQPGYRDLPASRIRPRNGSLLWLLDEAAGRDL